MPEDSKNFTSIPDLHAPMIGRLKMHRAKVAKLRLVAWGAAIAFVCMGLAYQVPLLFLGALFPLWVSYRIGFDLREMDGQIQTVEQDRRDWLDAKAEFERELLDASKSRSELS